MNEGEGHEIFEANMRNDNSPLNVDRCHEFNIICKFNIPLVFLTAGSRNQRFYAPLSSLEKAASNG